MDGDCVNVEYWTKLEDGRIECRLCPRFCHMRAGQRGLCFVRRAREDGEGMELTGYGRSTGFCVDPIEKKPLNHFLPGSSVLSFGTAGCTNPKSSNSFRISSLIRTTPFHNLDARKAKIVCSRSKIFSLE